MSDDNKCGACGRWLPTGEAALLCKNCRITLLQKYVALLQAELHEIVPLAASHGWKSSRHEEGSALRKKLGILSAEEQIKPSTGQK